MIQPALLVVVSMFVHLWLWAASRIFEAARPFGDLSLYKYWASQVNQGFPIYGLETEWVYPALAFIPVWLPSVISNYELGWLVLVFSLNTVLTVGLNQNSHRGFQNSNAGWTYLIGISCLGPIAISRIDSISVILAVFGLMAIGASRLSAATTLLTFAGWIKVWPVAVFLAMLASFKQRLSPILTASLISVSILAVGFSLGGEAVLSFVVAQQDRGLQIESVMATLWMWLARIDLAEIYFDEQILTNQIRGPGVQDLAASANFLLVLALVLVILFALRAKRKGMDPYSVFVWSSLAGVASLIAFNKVGSPQFMLWLLLPIVAGVYFHIPRFKPVLVVGLGVGLLTQLVYPIFYIELLALEIGPLVLLSVRNMLVIALLVIALLRLTGKQSLK